MNQEFNDLETEESFNNIDQSDNIDIYEIEEDKDIKESVNYNNEQIIEVPLVNAKLVANLISKKGKILMHIVLISTLIIFFDNFITSMDWFWDMSLYAVMNKDEQLKLALETIPKLIKVVNWLIVLIITIVSIIFLNIDKKKYYNIRAYKWYILAGILHIFVGTVGLTPILYSTATLVFSHKNKKYNKVNSKSDNNIIIFSSLLIAIIIFMFVAVKTNLF